MGFANRVENGGFFAKGPAARGFAVGRLRWAVARNAERAAPVAAPTCGREAGVGRAGPCGPRNRMTFSNFQ